MMAGSLVSHSETQDLQLVGYYGIHNIKSWRNRGQRMIVPSNKNTGEGNMDSCEGVGRSTESSLVGVEFWSRLVSSPHLLLFRLVSPHVGLDLDLDHLYLLFF